MNGSHYRRLRPWVRRRTAMPSIVSKQPEAMIKIAPGSGADAPEIVATSWSQ